MAQIIFLGNLVPVLRKSLGAVSVYFTALGEGWDVYKDTTVSGFRAFSHRGRIRLSTVQRLLLEEFLATEAKYSK
jgi:hypothetical protein